MCIRMCCNVSLQAILADASHSSVVHQQQDLTAFVFGDLAYQHFSLVGFDRTQTDNKLAERNISGRRDCVGDSSIYSRNA